MKSISLFYFAILIVLGVVITVVHAEEDFTLETTTTPDTTSIPTTTTNPDMTLTPASDTTPGSDTSPATDTTSEPTTTPTTTTTPSTTSTKYLQHCPPWPRCIALGVCCQRAGSSLTTNGNFEEL